MENKTKHSIFVATKRNSTFDFPNVLIDENNKMIIPFECDYIVISSNNVIYRKNKLYTILNKNLEMISELTKVKFDNIMSFGSDGMVVTKGNKFGYVDKYCNLIIPFKHDYLKEISIDTNILAARYNEKIGLIDKKDKIVVDFKYTSLIPSKYKEKIIYAQSLSYTGLLIEENNKYIEYKFSEKRVYKNVGSRDDTLHYLFTENDIYVHTGCFFGSIDCFELEVLRNHRGNEFAKEYKEIIKELREKFENIKIRRNNYMLWSLFVRRL